MAVVAIAGGSKSIGRAILEAILEQKIFTPIVLSREASPDLEKILQARVVTIDYSDPDAIARELDSNNVSVVISALGATADAEVNLIRGAAKSNSTTRFIPSVWGVRYHQEQAWFPPAGGKLRLEAELEGTSLEWTAVCNGFFLDYYGMPKVKSYLKPTTMVLDVVNCVAGIPDTGDTPVTFTYSQDVGKFTAALLTLPKWEKETVVIGDKLTFNEFVKLAEEVRGRKFQVTYDPLETLKSGKITELPNHVSVYKFFPKEQFQSYMATFQLFMAEGQFDFDSKKAINNQFPEIQPWSARKMLEEGWKA